MATYNYRETEKNRSKGRIIVHRVPHYEPRDPMWNPFGPVYYYWIAVVEANGTVRAANGRHHHHHVDADGREMTSERQAIRFAQQLAIENGFAFTSTVDCSWKPGYIENEAYASSTLTVDAEGNMEQTFAVTRRGNDELQVVVSVAHSPKYKGNKRTVKRAVEQIRVVAQTATHTIFEGIVEVFDSVQTVRGKIETAIFNTGRLPQEWISTEVDA